MSRIRSNRKLFTILCLVVVFVGVLLCWMRWRDEEVKSSSGLMAAVRKDGKTNGDASFVANTNFWLRYQNGGEGRFSLLDFRYHANCAHHTTAPVTIVSNPESPPPTHQTLLETIPREFLSVWKNDRVAWESYERQGACIEKLLRRDYKWFFRMAHHMSADLPLNDMLKRLVENGGATTVPTPEEFASNTRPYKFSKKRVEEIFGLVSPKEIVPEVLCKSFNNTAAFGLHDNALVKIPPSTVTLDSLVYCMSEHSRELKSCETTAWIKDTQNCHRDSEILLVPHLSRSKESGLTPT